jgi:hypothetical protein
MIDDLSLRRRFRTDWRAICYNSAAGAMKRTTASMQELIARIADVTEVDKAKAETGLAIILSLIRNHGEPEKVAALFAKLPGADALAARQARARAGGLLGKLGGGLMGAPLVAVSQLQAAGFSMAQIRSLGSEVLRYAREKAGDRLVREAAGSIPGLSGYL